MAGLRKAPFGGKVVFLGINSSRADDLASSALTQVEVGFAGFDGEDHGGLNREACSRLTNVHPEGTTIKNHRQVTVLSAEEMAETAEAMGIEGELDPCWVGANIVLSGVPSLTILPPGTRLRLPDGAVNPYLLQAVIIAAGLDGIRSQAEPGKRHDIDMYAEGHKIKGAPKLPLNLLDALREYDKDKSLKEAMGTEFSSAYLKMKNQEWQSYVSHFSKWEKDNTLDI